MAVGTERAAETPRPAWICPQWASHPKGQVSGGALGTALGTAQCYRPRGWGAVATVLPGGSSHLVPHSLAVSLGRAENWKKSCRLSDIPGSLGWGCICGQRWELPCVVPFKRPGVVWWPLVGLHELAWPSWLS